MLPDDEVMELDALTVEARRTEDSGQEDLHDRLVAQGFAHEAWICDERWLEITQAGREALEQHNRSIASQRNT